MKEEKQIQMTISQAVRTGALCLREAGIENAGHDSFALLAQLNGMDRTFYFTHGDEILPEPEYGQFMKNVARRAAHVPLQHILGKTWFYGYEFEVNEDVLIPRPDTEILVEEALKVISDGMCVLDLCTGSGCIVLTLAMERNLRAAVGADVSAAALNVAARNREQFMASGNNGLEAVHFIQSDLWSALSDWAGRLDVIVSNPPYIRTAVIPTLSEEVRCYDPLLALDGRSDGLYFYQEITAQAAHFLVPQGWLLFEIGHDQAKAVCSLMQENGFGKIKVIRDLCGLDRVVCGQLKSF